MNEVLTMDKNSPEYLTKKISAGRYSLQLIILLTVVNTVFLLADSDHYYVFSASIPYYLTAFGMGMDEALSGGIGTFTIIAVVIGVLVMGVYALCWACCEKKPGWLTAALVLFSVDTVGLLVVSFALLDDPFLNILDIIIHALVVYELARAVACAKKLKQQADTVACRTYPEIY